MIISKLVKSILLIEGLLLIMYASELNLDYNAINILEHQ